jgi:hypothetical protein
MRALQLGMARKEGRTVPVQGSSRWPCQYNLRDTDIEWPTNWNTASVAQDHTQTETQIPMSPTTSRGQDTPLKSGVSVQGSGKNCVEQPQQPGSLHTAHHPLRRNNDGQQKPFQKGKSLPAQCGSAPQNRQPTVFIKFRPFVPSRYNPYLSCSHHNPVLWPISFRDEQCIIPAKWSCTVRSEGIICVSLHGNGKQTIQQIPRGRNK